MRLAFLSAVMVGVLTVAKALGQPTLPSSPPPPPGGRGVPAALRFEDFPAAAGPPVRNAPLVLTPRDMIYRTRLRAAASERPNFAGYYVLVTWGCGTECLMGAAINARTGRVTVLPFATCCLGDVVNSTEDMITFRPGSTLLVLVGIRDERRADVGTHYYRIVGDRFVHLRNVPAAARR